jgi:uncharacterized protein YeaO (DUF488 family)
VPAPSLTNAVRSRSVYESAEASDGLRVLATRYWPRGVPRTAIDEYARALSPSEELLRSFKEGRVDWWGFRKRYLEEMRSPEAGREIDRLAQLATMRPVTVMCVCKEEGRCHRSLLRGLIADRTTRSSP